MFTKENVRIPRNPERSSFWELLFPKIWENMQRIQRCPQDCACEWEVGTNDFWHAPSLCGPKSLTLSTTEREFLKWFLDFVIREGNKTWLCSTIMLSSTGQETQTVLFHSLPPTHFPAGRFPVSRGYQHGHHFFKDHDRGCRMQLALNLGKSTGHEIQRAGY
jgi:hypothetical protein